MRDLLAEARAKHNALKINAQVSSDTEMVKIKSPRPRKRSIRKNILKTLVSKKRKKIMSHTKYVLNANIKSCFENINHD